MSKIDREHNVEKRLREETKRIGGLSLKLVTIHFNGLPDRLCLLPGGRLFFIELKTTKKKPRKLQLKVHKILRDLGFTVLVIDSIQLVNEFIKENE